MKKKVQIIGVPLDIGQQHRGVDMGPSAIRYAGLAEALQAQGYLVHDAGNIEVPLRYALPDTTSETQLTAISDACHAIYWAAWQVIAGQEIPIFLGGDHSLAIGSVGGVCHDATVGVIWIDAHGDFNTPRTSPSGNIHGMVLSTLLGQGYPALVDVGKEGAKLRPDQVVMIGVRDLDPKEKGLLQRSGCRVFTMRDIDAVGMQAVIKQGLDILSAQARIHVSLDMDVLDPAVAPGVGSCSPGGLTYREAQLLMEVIADSGKLSSVDVAEINPIIDHGNHTANLAVALLASLFGKRIL